MKYEKSCGAVIYRFNNRKIEFLIVLNKKPGANGHWGFPKGHKEGTENDYETASREVFEEVGLRVIFCGGIKATSNYSPKEGIEKDVVYFLATPKNDDEVKLQQEEIADYRWCDPEEAKSLLTFDKEILETIMRSM